MEGGWLGTVAVMGYNEKNPSSKIYFPHYSILFSIYLFYEDATNMYLHSIFFRSVHILLVRHMKWDVRAFVIV